MGPILRGSAVTCCPAGRRPRGQGRRPLPRPHPPTSSYVADDPDAVVCTVPAGSPLRRGNFRTPVGRSAAVAAIGAPGLHFHDLRHTGNTLAARTGASLRDLMTRTGHASTRAAMVYQHATSGRDAAIARAVDELLTAARRTTP